MTNKGAAAVAALKDPIEPESLLGGAPAPALPGLSPDGEKAARRQRKQEAKLRRDAERPPRSMERWRILMDIIDEARRVVELVDHKARYALVIMGVLNAGAFLILSRARLFSDLSPAIKPWMIGLLVLYAGLSCLFVFNAIDCLRPRQLRDTGMFPTAGPHGPLGLLYWELIGSYDLAGYQRAWSTVRLEQLNSELVLISHHLSRLIGKKYRALGRLYWGLGVLVILALVQLLAYAAFALAG